MGQFHKSLKQCSTEVHQLLDRQSILRYLPSESLSKDTYTKILIQYYVGYQSWQQLFDEALSRLDLDSTWRIDLCLEALKKEVEALGVAYKPQRLPAAMKLRSEAEYLACAYVFKGSSLGARMILSKLQSNPAINSGPDYYFFEAQANAGTESWKKWLERLEQEARVREISVEQIQLATLDCFETVYDWFGRLAIEVQVS